jgi:hypothetical protein
MPRDSRVRLVACADFQTENRTENDRASIREKILALSQQHWKKKAMFKIEVLFIVKVFPG